MIDQPIYQFRISISWKPMINRLIDWKIVSRCYSTSSPGEDCCRVSHSCKRLDAYVVALKHAKDQSDSQETFDRQDWSACVLEIKSQEENTGKYHSKDRAAAADHERKTWSPFKKTLMPHPLALRTTREVVVRPSAGARRTASGKQFMINVPLSKNPQLVIFLIDRATCIDS